jgi:hypothetical protein
MKQVVLLGVLILGTSAAYAQAPAQGRGTQTAPPAASTPAKPATGTAAKPSATPAKPAATAAKPAASNQSGSGDNAAAGHTAPKAQPGSAPAATAPTGTIALGSVHIPKSVKADGKPLAAGTYQVRVTEQAASPNAAGQSQGLERWMEFVQGGQVKGREVVTIIPQAEIAHVQKDTPPRANASKVETLKGGDYMRLWINRAGNHYLVHFPV